MKLQISSSSELDLSSVLAPLHQKFDQILSNQEKLFAMLAPAKPKPDPNPIQEPKPVFAVDLSDNQLGPYQLQDWQKDFNNPGKPWQPLTFLRVVEDSGEKVLRFAYPKGSFGNKGGGSNFNGILPQPLERAKLSYEIFFEKGFDFGLGGKMLGFRNTPSLSGGRGDAMDDSMGISARMMWVKGGKMKLYFYSHGMPGVYGWDLNAGVFGYMTPGMWHKVELEVGMNTVGKADGFVCVKQNGEELAKVENVVLRTAKSPQLLTELYCDTFMGGNTLEWSPDHDQFALIRNIRVY